MFTTTEPKWQLLAPKKLNLIGTQINIVYVGGGYPYHVHRLNACHSVEETLVAAKKHCLIVVAELMEMGVDP